MRGSIPSEEEQALKRLVAVVLAIALVCVPVAMGATASSSALEKQIASTPYQIWPAKARSTFSGLRARGHQAEKRPGR